MTVIWLDILIVFVLIYNILKGFKFGFIKSIFGIVHFILIIYAIKRYYPHLYGYIKNTPILYDSLLSVFQFILNIIFYRRVKYNPNFLDGIIKIGTFELFINILCLIAIYVLAHKILKVIFNLLSFIFSLPVLKQINKLSGIIFGFIKGILIIYTFFIIVDLLSAIWPNNLLSLGFKDSIILNYFIKNDIGGIF